MPGKLRAERAGEEGAGSRVGLSACPVTHLNMTKSDGSEGREKGVAGSACPPWELPIMVLFERFYGGVSLPCSGEQGEQRLEAPSGAN